MGSYGESRMGGVLEMYFVDAWTTCKKDTATISQPEGKKLRGNPQEKLYNHLQPHLQQPPGVQLGVVQFVHCPFDPFYTPKHPVTHEQQFTSYLLILKGPW